MVPPRPVMCLVFGRRFGVAARAFSLKGYVGIFYLSAIFADSDSRAFKALCRTRPAKT